MQSVNVNLGDNFLAQTSERGQRGKVAQMSARYACMSDGPPDGWTGGRQVYFGPKCSIYRATAAMRHGKLRGEGLSAAIAGDVVSLSESSKMQPILMRGNICGASF